MSMTGTGAVLGSDLTYDPHGLRVERLPEPVSTGLMYQTPSYQPQEEKAIVQVIEIPNDSP